MTSANPVVFTRQTPSGLTRVGNQIVIATESGQAAAVEALGNEAWNKIVTFDYPAIKAGLVPGYSWQTIVAHNPAVTTGSWRTLWPEDTPYVFPTSGIQPTISSTDDDDSAAGSGLQSVFVTYLDTSFNVQTETVPMNGQAGRLMAATDFFRFINMIGLTAGASDGHEGTVYLGTGAITAGKPANVYGMMAIQSSLPDNFSHVGVYTVPAGFTGYLSNIFASVDAGKFVEMQLRISRPGFLSVSDNRIDLSGASIDVPIIGGQSLPAQTDIELKVLQTSGTSADVHMTLEILLKADA